ncbi:MAG: magnesium and cobalt transport protein CorA [Gallionellaceae bacterium]|jgi:magnesium transporter|nr:magnesium and cobalt transport protein CorA [Gallionellaceae bacterium]
MSEEAIIVRGKNWRDALQILEKNRLALNVVHNQDMPHHDLVETLVRKQNLAKLDQALEAMDATEIASLLDAVPPEDQLFVWARLSDTQKEPVLREIPLSVLQVLGKNEYRNERSSIKAFDLVEGRLREITIDTRDDLANSRPIWVDLVAPTFEERIWVGDIFGIELPDPDKLGDLEASARFYIEESGEVHLRSDFLLDKDETSYNVAVAFILHNDILFSIRQEELPVFRLQRLRALSRPYYVSGAKDVLLDLYAADVEYSADTLEDVYVNLERVGDQVLSEQMTDEEAATMLSGITREEDMNGRIRRNVLDTRRAVSFLIRSRFLSTEQLDDAHQILRDIESLDGHTSFLFEKINFLMDATVGFININQNKVMKQLTVLSVVFMPLNVLAGIFGMSEFSMMTAGTPWPVSYGAFVIGLVFIAWLTFQLLRFYEKRRLSRRPAGARREA